MIVYQHKCTCKHTPKYNKTYKKKNHKVTNALCLKIKIRWKWYIYTYRELVKKIIFFYIVFGTLSNCNDNSYYI